MEIGTIVSGRMYSFPRLEINFGNWFDFRAQDDIPTKLRTTYKQHCRRKTYFHIFQQFYKVLHNPTTYGHVLTHIYYYTSDHQHHKLLACPVHKKATIEKYQTLATTWDKGRFPFNGLTGQTQILFSESMERSGAGCIKLLITFLITIL